MGSIVAVYMMSMLVRAVFLRKIAAPLKQYYSVLIACPISVILGAYGIADGGPPVFEYAIQSYGISSVIVLVFEWGYHNAYRKRKMIDGQ